MIWWAVVIEALAFAGIFSAIVIPTGMSDKKHSPSSIHNYPPDIQEEYFKTHERVNISYNSKKVIMAKSLGIIMFCVILLVSALLAGASTFLEGFLLSLGLMLWIGLYDTMFIDWILFANIKVFRLEGTEHMDAAYHQKWFHLKGMLFPGAVFGTIPALIVGSLIALIR